MTNSGLKIQTFSLRKCVITYLSSLQRKCWGLNNWSRADNGVTFFLACSALLCPSLLNAWKGAMLTFSCIVLSHGAFCTWSRSNPLTLTLKLLEAVFSKALGDYLSPRPGTHRYTHTHAQMPRSMLISCTSLRHWTSAWSANCRHHKTQRPHFTAKYTEVQGLMEG